MSKFDEIIGYAGLKKELLRIADVLKNGEVYAKLGVSAPRGLLLYGEPGVGKSLMASAIIEEIGRNTYTCRKNQPNGDFVKEIKATFEKAMENTPSVIFLDDMDKFANGDEGHPDAEEYVTVQSCIDEAKGKEVFVLATANNVSCLPDSLRRAGRFDREIEVFAPKGKDAEAIIAHYLKNKKTVDDVDAAFIARIMEGRSCAALENIVNAAGFLAGYERAELISMDHFIEAMMQIIFNVPAESGEELNEDPMALLSDSNHAESQVIYHEAGHAVAFEVLCPGSVTLISAHNRGGRNSGFVNVYDDESLSPLHLRKSRIVGGLVGRAAVENKFGFLDVGSGSDLDRAFSRVRNLVVDHCSNGFQYHSRSSMDDSQSLMYDQEKAVAVEVEHYYKKAQEIIALNTEFLEKIAVELAQKKLLISSDIQRIKSTCKIVPVAL